MFIKQQILWLLVCLVVNSSSFCEMVSCNCKLQISFKIRSEISARQKCAAEKLYFLCISAAICTWVAQLKILKLDAHSFFNRLALVAASGLWIGVRPGSLTSSHQGWPGMYQRRHAPNMASFDDNRKGFPCRKLGLKERWVYTAKFCDSTGNGSHWASAKEVNGNDFFFLKRTEVPTDFIYVI